MPEIKFAYANSMKEVAVDELMGGVEACIPAANGVTAPKMRTP